MEKIKDLLSILRTEGFVSLYEISENLKVSADKVKKAVCKLRSYGYKIETKRGSGYKLICEPDRLYPWEIESHLSTITIGRKIIYREVLDSTNTCAYELAKKGANEGTCIIAEKQTRGKGRLERNWFSPESKNIYMSIILRPQVPFSEISMLPFLSCLSIWELVKMVSGLSPALKWPNDVLVGERKLSGTLVEVSTRGKKVDFAIVGIGLNVNMEEEELPEDLKEIATSLYMETGRKYCRAYLCAILLNIFEKYYGIFLRKGSSEVRSLWEEKAQIKGKSVTVAEGDRLLKGLCEGLDRDGSLLLKTSSGIQKVYAGDLTLKRCSL